VSDKRPTSVIERAAQRLAQLKNAGIDVAPPAAGASAQREGAVALDPGQPLPPMPPLGPATAAPAAPRVAAPAPAAAAAAPPARRVDIDLDRLAGMSYLTPAAPRSQLADEYRVIKRSLLQHIDARPAEAINPTNLIMVTSALPGEGKTFTAINLAMSMASELDRTVLLVDADVQRPAVLDRLGLPRSKGLLDLLTDPSVALHDVLLKTNVDKLALLPAGTAHAQATELLASDAMDRLLVDISSRYPDRVLVFDAPPLLASTESRVLATHMGQVVVVVSADKTPQASLMEAMRTIESCPLVYSVLNKTRRVGAGSYYGYYGYGY
jgi:receptor protein-tyrosine kinase